MNNIFSTSSYQATDYQTLSKELNNTSHKFSQKIFKAFLYKAFDTINPATQYSHNWHIDLIADYLQACENGAIKRLIINIPPRHLKSVLVNVAWPAWLLGHNPAARIISASYSQSLANKHSLDTRLLLQSFWYQNLFPQTTITTDQNKKEKFLTTKRGFRLATSVGGTLTGEGGNFLILDDPHNPAHMYSQTMREATLNWYEQVFASRLDNKKTGVIVLIMQRLHEKDLTGHLLAKNSGWQLLSIPAIAEKNIFYPLPSKNSKNYLFEENSVIHPEKETLENLNQTKAELGSFTFSAQYLQNPLPLEDGLINRAWLKFYKTPPAEFKTIVQSWDTAIKSGAGNDYSVCTTWGETETAYYLLDVYRQKLEFPALKRMIISLAEKHKPTTILIEDKASGGSIIQDIRASSKLPIIAINPKGEKLVRVAQTTSLYEAGKVFINEKAPYLGDLENELLGFPHTPHDDQIDSISQYLNWTRTKNQVLPSARFL